MTWVAAPLSQVSVVEENNSALTVKKQSPYGIKYFFDRLDLVTVRARDAAMLWLMWHFVAAAAVSATDGLELLGGQGPI